MSSSFYTRVIMQVLLRSSDKGCFVQVVVRAMADVWLTLLGVLQLLHQRLVLPLGAALQSPPDARRELFVEAGQGSV
jgi:hypothetical protein